MDELKKQLENIIKTLPLMINLGSIDQSAYKTLDEALNEALQQYAIIKRNELISIFSWISCIGEQFFDSNKTIDDIIDIYENSKQNQKNLINNQK